jgi:hypothetical protein
MLPISSRPHCPPHKVPLGGHTRLVSAAGMISTCHPHALLPPNRNFELSSNSLPSSGITQAPFTPPVSLPPLTQPKHVISTSPNNNPTSSSADPHSQLPTVARDSEICAAPSLSRATSSSASAPIAPKTSREVRKEEETPPRPIPPPKPSQSDGQPSSATVPLESQKRPTASLRDTGDDTLPRLPDDRHHGETPTLSLVQVDSSQEVVENTPRAKSSLVQSSGTPSFVSLIDFDTYSLYYLIARTAPPMVKVSSNMKEKRGTQAQSGHTISQLQHPQGENGGVVPPNDRDRLDPLTRQTEILLGTAYCHWSTCLNRCPIRHGSGCGAHRSRRSSDFCRQYKETSTRRQSSRFSARAWARSQT